MNPLTGSNPPIVYWPSRGQAPEKRVVRETNIGLGFFLLLIPSLLLLILSIWATIDVVIRLRDRVLDTQKAMFGLLLVTLVPILGPILWLAIFPRSKTPIVT